MAAVHLDNGGLVLLGWTTNPSDTMTMSWDEVCSRFETLNLNWDPAMLPVTAVRHWYVVQLTSKCWIELMPDAQVMAQTGSSRQRHGRVPLSP